MYQSLTQMTLQSTQSGGRTYMEGMEIDGKLLVDDNITVNSPSIAPTGCSVGTKQGFSIISTMLRFRFENEPWICQETRIHPTEDNA